MTTPLKLSHAWLICLLSLGMGFFTGETVAQRGQTFAPHETDKTGGPPAIVWPTPDLRDRSRDFESAEERHLRLTVVANDLEQPWSVAFLPDGAMLVTERPGRLRLIRNGKLDRDPIVAARYRR